MKVPPLCVALPAGPSHRYVARYRVSPGGRPDVLAPPRLVPPDASLGDRDDVLVAVDMDGTEADAAATERGASAVPRLGDALLRLGTARLAAGDADDAAELVPAYVTLPRGLSPAVAEREWSPDLR